MSDHSSALIKEKLNQKKGCLETDMAKKPKPSEQRLVLEKISWQQFEALLTEMGADRTARFTYDRGRLELMTPLEEHDRSMLASPHPLPCHRQPNSSPLQFLVL